MINNIIASVICKKDNNSSFLDSNNIVWKWINNEWIGKRAVQTFDLRTCWLEETSIDRALWAVLDNEWLFDSIDESSLFPAE